MSSSYAVSPDGKRVRVEIKDGKTYTTDGKRVGTGYTVQTGGGIYKMTDKGGVKVDSHNAPSGDTSDRKRTSTREREDRRTSSRESGSRTRDDDPRRDIASSLAKKDSNIGKIGDNFYYDKSYFEKKNSDPSTYQGSSGNFNRKYDSIIKKLAEHNKVDMGVARNMLASNIEQSMKGLESKYQGGGVIASEQWKQIVNDYTDMKGKAYNEIKDREYTDTRGNKFTGKDLIDDLKDGGPAIDYSLGENKSGKTQGELKTEYETLYGAKDPGEFTESEGIIRNYLTNYGRGESTGGARGRDPSGSIMDIISSLPADVLNYRDAQRMANDQMGYEYDKALEEAMKNIDRQSLQSGFFGQLPTMDYKQRNADDIERSRAMAISQLAQQLMNDSQADALNKANALMGYEAHRENLSNNEWSRLFQERSYQDGRADIDWEKLFKEKTYSDGREDVAWEKSMKEAGLTGIFNGQPTLAMTELAHAMGMDEQKMQMAELELNHDIEIAYEKLKNDKVALSQAWSRIGLQREGQNLDRDKFMAGIKEQAWKMTMDEMDKQGVSVGSEGTDFESWLSAGGPTSGGGGLNNAQLEQEIETIWGSYIKQLLDDTQFSGYYK